MVKNMTLYRTVYTIEVLSKGFPMNTSEIDLSQLVYGTGGGSYSGVWHMESQEEVTPERMSELLTSQGSDPKLLDERVFDEGECLCPMYENHGGKCDGLECGCHGCQDPSREMLSVCCEANPLDDTSDDNLGFCSKCKEGSVFETVCVVCYRGNHLDVL